MMLFCLFFVLFVFFNTVPYRRRLSMWKETFSVFYYRNMSENTVF